MIKYLCFLFLLPFLLFADQVAFDVTQIGTSAGLLSRGGVEGFSHDYSVVYENPAGLMKLHSFGVGSFYANTLGGQVRFFNLSAGKPFSFGHMAVSYMAVQVPDIFYTGLSGGWPVRLGSFDYKDSLLKISFAKSYQFLYWGVSFNHYDYRMQYYSGSGQNFDFGVLLNTYPFTFSLCGKNIIPFLKMKYNNHINLPFASSYTLAAKLAFSYVDFYSQVKYQRAYKDHFLGAAGVSVRPSFLSFLMLSSGVSQSLSLDRKVLCWNVGVGLRLNQLRFDFSYQKTDYFPQDNQYCFSLHLLNI